MECLLAILVATEIRRLAIVDPIVCRQARCNRELLAASWPAASIFSLGITLKVWLGARLGRVLVARVFILRVLWC